MRIIHVSDTHLGRRPKNTRSDTINQQFKPLEDDFYSSWIKIIDNILKVENRPDIIVHSGDFFDIPSLYNPYPPPELARIKATETFNKLCDSNIPIVIIDGNHGRYENYRDSTLSMFPQVFKNVHIFTHYDIKEAIQQSKPLFKDFDNLNLRIFAHPYINIEKLPSIYQDLYTKWINIQNNSINKNKINIAIAHGMIENGSLHPKLFNGKYNYLALGDNHKRQKIRENAWYAGSTELWDFKEYNYEKGYLIIDIEDRDANPEVIPVSIKSNRKIIYREMNISDNDTNSSLVDKIINIFQINMLNSKYNYDTAARVKIKFNGERSYGNFFNLNEVIWYLQSKILDTDEYNIVEFIVDVPNYNKSRDNYNLENNIDFEYLIEDPEKEFREFISSYRSDSIKERKLNPNYLAKLFAELTKGGTSS